MQVGWQGWYYDKWAAAKAYDKAAVYLYGDSAITNFGIAACQDDPTQVSNLIIQAWKTLKAADAEAAAEATPAHANPDDRKQEAMGSVEQQQQQLLLPPVQGTQGQLSSVQGPMVLSMPLMNSLQQQQQQQQLMAGPLQVQQLDASSCMQQQQQPFLQVNDLQHLIMPTASTTAETVSSFNSSLLMPAPQIEGLLLQQQQQQLLAGTLPAQNVDVGSSMQQQQAALQADSLQHVLLPTASTTAEAVSSSGSSLMMPAPQIEGLLLQQQQQQLLAGTLPAQNVDASSSMQQQQAALQADSLQHLLLPTTSIAAEALHGGCERGQYSCGFEMFDELNDVAQA
ncbi:hypothetical protein OEZ85_000068 [Tetradesmus obliquus]|uniref:AP2/ERF domain-containing protein n=1 Tax=Tetradesmus obliquus TaxID=3088 RepID=A0ABY8USH6_TETOB|nr:hypothetical protein OEZ85_000068 [Tetradesmus obliquus]